MNSKTTLAVVVVVAALLASSAMAVRRPAQHELATYTFEKYVADFNKPHKAGTPEYERRAAIFAKRLAEIVAFNKEGHSWKKGINHMSDWTVEERRALNGNLPKGMTAPKLRDVMKTHKVTDLPLPKSLDYRNAVPAVLTGVKDQGMCGSCWAHAATEQIETYWAMATSELFTLSQQQITSCTPNPNQCGGSGGCSGGTAELAWEYVMANGGIAQEWTYGYSSYFGNTGTCQYNASQTVPVAKLTGYSAVQRNDAGAVMDALVHVGPLAISVEADTWGDYESGVFTGCPYSKNITMDHAVQLVGFGFDGGLNMNYWIVRNSWSPAWGESGYIRLFKEAGAPECGWNNDWVTMGGGCKGQPNTVWACGTCGILYDTVYPNVDTN